MNCKLKVNMWMFQQLEIVPLYGDMQVAPFQYIKNSTNFDSSKWPCCESSQVSPQSNILANLEPIREDHMSYISQLSRHSNEVSVIDLHFNLDLCYFVVKYPPDWVIVLYLSKFCEIDFVRSLTSVVLDVHL